MRNLLITIAAAALSLLAADKPLAAQDTTLADVLIDGQNWELVADGFKFVKGLAADAEGTLYFSDLTDGKIYRLAADGKPEEFVANSGATAGLMFGPDGQLYGCQMEKKRIVAFDKTGREREVCRTEFPANDLVVTKGSVIYFTDPDNRRIQFVAPGGKTQIVDRGGAPLGDASSPTGIGRPTGIALWPGQGTLVAADAIGSQLWAFRIEADGTLAHNSPFYQLQISPDHPTSGADGMTVDSQGRLYVATSAGIQMFDVQGRLSGVIAKPSNAFVSNVKFGGPKLDILYAAASDKLFRRKMKVSGVNYFAAKAEK